MSKRRTKGEGSITKRKDGRWMARYRATDANGDRKTYAIYAKAKEEAAKLLRQRLKEIDDGDFTIRDGSTLNGFYSYWKNDLAPNYLKETTIWGYDMIFQKHILPMLGKKRLTDINPIDIQKLITKVKKATNSPRQCYHCRDALSSVLKRALKQRKIYYNPAAGVELPKYKKKEKVLWDLDELSQFLETARKHSRFYVLYLLMANYGLRMGESLGIRYSDIDFETRVKDGCGLIHIRQQVVILNYSPTISTPKTESSIRDLVITREIADALTPLMLKRNQKCELLFHTSNNTPISPYNLRRDFNRIIKLAGVKHTTPHALRHWACTEMNSLGADGKTIQSIMGHSSYKTTADIYEHTRLDDKAKASAILSKRIFSAMAV